MSESKLCDCRQGRDPCTCKPDTKDCTRLPVVAYEREWSSAGVEPYKEKNDKGRMVWPFRFKLLPLSKIKLRNDDVPLCRLTDAQALIAELQADVGKARAAQGLTSRLLNKANEEIRTINDRYFREVYGVNNEGDPIGGGPAGGYVNQIAALRAQLEQLHAAPAERGVVQSKAAIDVLAERKRQITAEGWTPEHDNEHGEGQMATAGGLYAQYAFCVREMMVLEPPMPWPWHPSWWKPTTPRRNLVKAGALIVAEIERLDRLNPAPAPAPATAEQAWIPVSERLPDGNAPILVAYKFGGIYTCRRSVIEHDLAADEPQHGERDRPTHWMPLPAAPATADSDVREVN